MRVKVRLSEMADGSHLLQFDAFAVQNSEDPFFQTGSRNVLLDRRPYQKLLNEVPNRLKRLVPNRWPREQNSIQ